MVSGIGSTLKDESKSVGFNIEGLIVLDKDHVLLKSSASASVLRFNSDGFHEVVSLTQRVDSAAMHSDILISISGKYLKVHNMKISKQIFEAALPGGEESFAPVNALHMSVKEAIELLLVRMDCRIEFIIIDIPKLSVVSEWVREEALARISAVEMVDLPLSELQQMIEDEFEEGGTSGIMSSFIRRLISQTSQIHKWLLKTINEIFAFSYMISTRTNSFSKLLHHVRSAAKSGNHSGEVLERDFFNLRKLIVATTLDGVAFGLDSSDGSIVWRLWLDTRFAPLSSFTGRSEVPLFVQRSTAHYQLPGQAAVAFKDSVSSTGVLVFFNPITGKVVGKTRLATAISRVDILNFVGQEHIYPLLVVGSNEEISIHPAQSDALLATAPPVYILIPESSHISGAVIDFLEKKIVRRWTADLHLAVTEKIIIVKGKPRHQKMHSQGRVLIDRNVQYKYANPNLVAIASLDSVHQYLSIFLVDVVSGQMIHSARLAKATAPVHLVHCEHWIAYSYWSEKGRRTEIGILELYEGSEQTNKDRFDSLSPTKKAPEVITQSFIYAQGIQAMAVSETEKGLTTRSLLMALPLGGIHEVTRKLLDATRPLELTQEMREEMMIPYIPEIPIATEDMVNYNQTVHGVRGIKTAASGLESTSLMIAYGIDVFFTRLHPSGTFDILKDDFDHVLISIVLFGLIAGSIISKKLARNNALSAAWA
ncbi:ER membrane protein complex subunit 1 [Trichostrongylus colubriformis]|uniref:ER membrane protein complex subunit 1 n=1 Tax=Trichostrongylus colubriformis TaxID=6319 RepID=A0AAN8J3K4_TRICO